MIPKHQVIRSGQVNKNAAQETFYIATSDELSGLRDHGLDRDHEITVSTVSDLRPHGPPADWEGWCRAAEGAVP